MKRSITIELPKPRNPVFLMAKLRKAGQMRKTTKALRKLQNQRHVDDI